MFCLETARLRIRSIDIKDDLFILKLLNEPSFLEHIGDKGVHSLDDSQTFIQSGAWVQQSPEGYGQFIVECLDDPQPMGVCGILYREPHSLSDVGFAFLPEFWGKGYALESARAISRYGFETLGLSRICGLTSKANQASIKVLTRMGMTYDGDLPGDPGTQVYSVCPSTFMED